MNRDPHAWQRLGRALRTDRERQGLTREKLAEIIKTSGVDVSTRTIARLESGEPPRMRMPQSLEPVTAGLGWPAGRAEEILSGLTPEDADPHGEPVLTEEEVTFVLTHSHARAIWDTRTPVEERVAAIRDLMAGEKRRSREERDAG